MSVLGTTEPHWASAMLGTGYEQFHSPTGINGLAKVNGDRVDILALDARDPGSGQFRTFMDQCKQEFETICIWEVWSPVLRSVLPRYGFSPFSEVDKDTGEALKGFRYVSPHPTTKRWR